MSTNWETELAISAFAPDMSFIVTMSPSRSMKGERSITFPVNLSGRSQMTASTNTFGLCPLPGSDTMLMRV